MSSDDSDDEPLSILAAAKKKNPDKFEFLDPSAVEVIPVRKRKKERYEADNNLSITIKLCKSRTNDVKVVERPTDVWLYMKDLNPTGPYSCLLCSFWFINRVKLILHYVLNHKKDFCGICRYFVPEREDWLNHTKFHTPWPCSQCTETYPTEGEMRKHLSVAHNLVHCRLCHFRTSDDEQYDNHLFQKHNVSNVSSKHSELLWEIQYDGVQKFLCLLCAKGNNLPALFFTHYMGFHHFTLKCLTSIISGIDLPFTVEGANVSTEFIEGQLKNQERIGYVDMNKKVEPNQLMESVETTSIVLVPEVKQEIPSENEDDVEADTNKEIDNSVSTYKGEQDFDVTLVELIVLQKSYYEYANRVLNHINSNTLADEIGLDYKALKRDLPVDVTCSLCKTRVTTVQTFVTHMSKIHSVKSVPLYSCRVCATTFDARNEFENHVLEEFGEFDDLWLCQFCDKEFSNREETRKHLNEHWEIIDYDNCFSPHLGFKCKYCPTLFWNETDRETHQVRVHYINHKNDFYKCQNCSEIFSDKVWFIHHFLDKHHAETKDVKFLFKCLLCSLALSTMDEMRSHFTLEHPEARKIFCTLGSCMYRPLSQRKSLKLHVKTFHANAGRGPNENTSSCPMCGREFSSARACGAHMSQAHGTGKFKCKLCREVMTTMDERKLHYLIRHPGRHPFECAECGKSFQYKSSLYMHKQEHSPNKQSYTCTYCGKVFMKKDSFREHVQIHEGPRHACSYCPMRFVQRSNMLRHERRHTGERPYACPQCPRTFADKGACTSHLRTHSKDRSYACIYCGQTFVQKSKLTYHIRKHTGENLETCPVCSKLFTSACSLREHMRIHDRKQMEAVQCPLCDRKYQNGRYMMRHLRTLHNQERFSCPLCRKSLTSVAGLRHHVVTHGRANMYKCKVCPKSYAVRRTLMKHLRKRHGIKTTDLNVKDYFQRLDPRDCNLPLDEETITKIFGPRQKKTNNDILIGDFVTFTKTLKIAANLEHVKDDDDDDDDEEDDDEQDKGSGEDSDGEYGKDIVENQDEAELEPTDFVSVKIEHVEEEEEIDDN